jgi:hypothetical protein
LNNFFVANIFRIGGEFLQKTNKKYFADHQQHLKDLKKEKKVRSTRNQQKFNLKRKTNDSLKLKRDEQQERKKKV